MDIRIIANRLKRLYDNGQKYPSIKDKQTKKIEYYITVLKDKKN